MLAALLALSGCKDREIHAYRAPKDPAPATTAAAAPASGQLPADHPPLGQLPADHPPLGQLPADHPPLGQSTNAGDMSGPPVATASGNALTWTAPASWQPKAPGPVRKGSYTITGNDGATADLAITAFPGDTGGLFANVNRWRAQVGLAPLNQSQLDTAVEHVDLNEFHIDLVDLLGNSGGQPTRVLGAIVPHAGQTWFFKISGPDALVAAEKPAFRAFLGTIKPATTP